MFEQLKNMGDMVKKAKEMRNEMKRIQEELKSYIITETAVGGLLSISLNGEMEMVDISIHDDLLQPKNREKLQEAIKKLYNKTAEKAKKEATGKLSALTGGLNIPGLT